MLLLTWNTHVRIKETGKLESTGCFEAITDLGAGAILRSVQTTGVTGREVGDVILATNWVKDMRVARTVSVALGCQVSVDRALLATDKFWPVKKKESKFRNKETNNGIVTNEGHHTFSSKSTE